MLSVISVPCLRDNYAYLVFDPAHDGACVVVDACEFAPVDAALKKYGLRPHAILTTHHHWDHVGGNRALSEKYSLPIYAHATELARIEGMTTPLQHREAFEVAGAGLAGVALHNPGHTQGAVTFVFGKQAFSGDTLFCAGCGRLKEGTAEQLHHSLCHVLGELDDDVLVYTGHEYTESNLAFACSTWPTPAILARYADVRSKREQGQFTASTTMGLERSTNLFLLTHLDELQARLGIDSAQPHGATLAFAELRKRKDAF